jgi:nicotinate dehydrogenase subunit A
VSCAQGAFEANEPLNALATKLQPQFKIFRNTDVATKFILNGKAQVVNVDSSTPLLYVLRDTLGLKGPKFGCGLGQCGTCTVVINGEVVLSCVTPVAAAQDKRITTLEGLGNTRQLHPLQKAFIEEQAAQCAYCVNGIIMHAKVLLDKNPQPSDEDIRRALDPVLCRCGSHLRIIRAIKRAAHAMRPEGH